MRLMDHLPWDSVDADNLNFLRAIGVEGLLVHIPRELIDGEDRTDDFRRLKGFVEDHGLTLEVLHSHFVPRDKIVHGLPGRDEQIEVWKGLLRAIGKAGVQRTATTFYAISHFRTPPTVGRGGARYSTFDHEVFLKEHREFPDKSIGEAELFANIEYFLKQVVPVAEEAGVRIALHPDDPPIPDPLGGAARIVCSLDNYERFFGMAPSDSNGMLFCQGCVAEMGEDVVQAIHRVGSQKKIVFVHFRDIRGTPHKFQEVFIDEGDNDMMKAMEAYRDVGYDGPAMLDHTPGIPGDEQGRLGHAYANGYLRAMIQAVYR